MDNYITLLSKHRSAIMGFAILWIMLFHLQVSIDFIPLKVIKKLGYGGVDIFLFLSGFGLYYSCSKNNFNKRTFYKNRFKRILPEFYLVLIVVFLLKKDFSCQSFYTLFCHATTMGLWVWGRIPYVLWYISCILMFYAIFPQYYLLFKKHGTIIPSLCICGGLILMFLYAVFCFYFYDKENIGGNVIFAYARIPIFFLGSYFGRLAKDNIKITLKLSHKIFALATSLFFLIVLLVFITHIPSNILRVSSLYFIPFIIITPILCIVLALIFNNIHIIDKIFAYIGSLSLELYLCHAYIFKQLNHFISNYGSYIAICFVILLSFISAYMLHFINKNCLQKFFSV